MRNSTGRFVPTWIAMPSHLANSATFLSGESPLPMLRFSDLVRTGLLRNTSFVQNWLETSHTPKKGEKPQRLKANI
jgi:hypothetical protein